MNSYDVYYFLSQVYGVRALNADGSLPFYKEIARSSGGQFLKLGHFDIITDMFLAGKAPILQVLRSF